MEKQKEDMIGVGKFLFKLKKDGMPDIIKTKFGDYARIKNIHSQFLEDAILKEMNLSNDYDVYIRYNSNINWMLEKN